MGEMNERSPARLARQLVEHPRWRWQPGMVLTTGDIVESLIGTSQAGVFGVVTGDRKHHNVVDVTIDIAHPATKGWLLHALTEAATVVQLHTGRHELFVEWIDAGGSARLRWFREDDAIAEALLAVWGEP